MKTIQKHKLLARQDSFLARCFADGHYTTERATDFWSKTVAPYPGVYPTLAGERMTIGSEVQCVPLFFTGRALLVSITDSKGRDWFSWIHAEIC